MGDMLSQDEINALLGLVDDNAEATQKSEVSEENNPSNSLQKLSVEEKDIIGEIGNISMGTSATTLFSLLNQKVQITTPKVDIISWKELAESYDRPCVGIRVSYKEGISGSNILILKENDVKIITNLMMGGDGTNIEEGSPISDIELSAIGEAMNQMVGSSATSLSSLIGKKVDINTPKAFLIDFNDEAFFENLGFEETDDICRIAFRMEIGTLIDSQIMQIFTVDFAKEMAAKLKQDSSAAAVQSAPKQEDKVEPKKQDNIKEQKSEQVAQMPSVDDINKYAKSSNTGGHMQNVSTAQFQSFDMTDFVQQRENIEIIKDVPLEVTVELGRTKKRIKEILEFSPGTIIELDKIAGEPIDILVNGKFVAKGEVVVIDENFGIRISDIISVENRI